MEPASTRLSRKALEGPDAASDLLGSSPGVTRLENGEEIFPAMLAAIRAARRSVCFETYIYWFGSIAHEFADALSAKAREGVPVHVLLDWSGSLEMDDELIEQMREGGVEVERFRPLRWFNLRRVNYRTHRKLLMVDGRVGFTGGVGIADVWRGHGQDPDHWRDNHYRFTGAVVGEMQRAFFSNWAQVGRPVPEVDDGRYYPELVPSPAFELVSGAPWRGDERLDRLFRGAIDDAQESLRISSAYFVPGEGLMEGLVRARERGVEVEVITCGTFIDKRVVRLASRALWGRLLGPGVRIFEYQPTLYHVKFLVVDDRWVSVGSANFDERSCRLNDELNVNVSDPEVVAEHIEVFRRDREASREMTFEEWKNRPWIMQAKDWLAETLRSQL